MKNWLVAKKAIMMWGGVVLAFVLLATFVSMTSAVVVALFLIMLLLDIDNGIALAIALVLLLLCPFLLALKQKSGAEVLANWAYYFLAMGVILQLLDYVRSGVENGAPPPADWK